LIVFAASGPPRRLPVSSSRQVERLEVLGLKAEQRCVAEVGEQVVLDAGDVAGVR
jgi:hypothetical protein